MLDAILRPLTDSSQLTTDVLLHLEQVVFVVGFFDLRFFFCNYLRLLFFTFTVVTVSDKGCVFMFLQVGVLLLVDLLLRIQFGKNDSLLRRVGIKCSKKSLLGWNRLSGMLQDIGVRPSMLT